MNKKNKDRLRNILKNQLDSVTRKPDSEKIQDCFSRHIERMKKNITDLIDWAEFQESKGTDSTATYNIIQRHANDIEVMQHFFSMELRIQDNN